MRFLNRDRYVLRLPCSRLTALGILRAYTWNKMLNSQRTDKYFSSTLEENNFCLMPLISVRNAWLPALRGRINEEEDACRVEIEAKPCLFTRIFMAIWYGGLAVAAAMLILSVQPAGIPLFLLPLTVPALLALLGFLLSHFAFWVPARRVKRQLLKIWGGEEI